MTVTVFTQGLRFRGAWSNTVAYTVGDVVSQSGVSYACITAHTGQTPPNVTYWDSSLIAGIPGPAGASVGSELVGTAPNQLPVWDGSQWALLPQSSLTGPAGPTGAAGPGARALGVSLAGALPATGTDCADVPIIVSEPVTLTKMKCVCKVGPTGAMTVQLRRSTNSGSTWANVTGFVCTFAGSGAVTAVVDPADVAVSENDLLGFSIATGSGTTLVSVLVGTI